LKNIGAFDFDSPLSFLDKYRDETQNIRNEFMKDLESVQQNALKPQKRETMLPTRTNGFSNIL